MNINEVRKLIYKHGEKIGLPYDSKLYPIFSSTGNVFSDGGTIYISNNEYHYVIMERGKENKHYRSLDINDILYPLFEGITFSLASKYELKNRNEKEDPRKLLWSKQLELLGKIDPLFKERCQKEIDSILKIAPYKKCNWQKIDVYRVIVNIIQILYTADDTITITIDDVDYVYDKYAYNNIKHINEEIL